MARKPATISQLNDYIAKTIKIDPILGNIYAIGVISDLKYHSSGHVYFSASDADSKIRCMIPYSYAKFLDFKLENGQEIKMNGYIDLYKKGGSYSLIVKNVEVEGIGKAALDFQYLMEKLKKEGLFDQSHKRPIAAFPKSIGVITAETGAALQDILKIIRTRNDYVDVYVFPVQVQGDKAPADMVKALNFANEHYDFIDTLIIGRGGGSQEDLIPFNDENLARAIYASKIPVISAVGHEIDFSISDFVADMRAETPTAAAQIAVPDLYELKDKVVSFRKNLKDQLVRLVDYNQLQINNYRQTLNHEITNKINSCQNIIDQYRVKIDSNNPYEIFKKGYSALLSTEGKVISSVKDVKSNKTYDLLLNDGKIKVKVLEDDNDGK